GRSSRRASSWQRSRSSAPRAFSARRPSSCPRSRACSSSRSQPPQQHLSLHGVERKSGGRWKAVVVGSYERGDRAVSVQRLAELAEFYGVPVGELLPKEHPQVTSGPGLSKIVLNLQRLHSLPPEEADAPPRVAAPTQPQP